MRTLQRRLAIHGIATVGKGRLARITLEDFNRLIEAERQLSLARMRLDDLASVPAQANATPTKRQGRKDGPKQFPVQIPLEGAGADFRPDIFRAAKLLIDQHGANGSLSTAGRAETVNLT